MLSSKVEITVKELFDGELGIRLLWEGLEIEPAIPQAGP